MYPTTPRPILRKSDSNVSDLEEDPLTLNGSEPPSLKPLAKPHHARGVSWDNSIVDSVLAQQRQEQQQQQQPQQQQQQQQE
jgi:hypothetical protein